MRSRHLVPLLLLGSALAASAEFLLSGFSGNHVKRFDASTGASIDTYVPDNGNGLNLPHELLFGPDLNLYVCSAGNDSIYRYDGFNGTFLGAFVPSGSGGLDYPASMIWGPNGDLFVASQLSNEILQFDGTTGSFVTSFVSAGSGGLNGPSGLLFGPNSNLYVVARFGNQVLEYDGGTGTFVGVAAGSNLSQPFGLDFGPDGNLYVASGNNARVQRFDGVTGVFIDSFATSNLALPVELEFGPDGDLYVASFSSGSVEVFNGTTGQWIQRFVDPGPGAANGPNFFAFRPPQIHPSGAVRWVVNSQNDHEYGIQNVLPAGFGAAEFTLEFFIRLDNTFPVGPVGSGFAQRNNWFDDDPMPYDSGSWWFDGNFLLDGHNNNSFEQGTCSVQFYGGGRLRWQFGDGGSVPSGGVWAVQAFPATNSPTLLDGAWHEVSLVRRWSGVSDASLELWIDGALVGSETSDVRTDMPATYWNSWAGFPVGQEGWFWGAEKQAAIGVLSQYEDYKGYLDEIRFWDRALTTNELAQSRLIPLTGTELGLLDRIGFDEGDGTIATGRLASGTSIDFINLPGGFWETENAPFDFDGDALPDWWEEVHYGGATNAIPDQDTDGDGADAIHEFTSRSSPTNQNERLTIRVISPPDPSDEVEVRWQSIGGRRYRVEIRNDSTGPFTPVVLDREPETEMDVALDALGDKSFLDTSSTNQNRLDYRVRIVE